MSEYIRTGLRVTIRQAAPPLLLCYVMYKFYLKANNQPWFKQLTETYRKLYWKIYWRIRG